jgi:peptide/nickel transport system permease protein
MLQYVVRRLAIAIPLIYGLTTLVFLLMHLLPGDAVSAMLTQFAVSAAEQAQLRHELGLDEPLIVQYGRYILNVSHGDFGRSLFNHQLVTDQILSQLPATLQLAFAGMGIAIPLGLLLGILSAVNEHGWVDRLSMLLSLFGVAMPTFWTGLVLIYVFSVWLDWLPTAGSGSVQQLILPALALSAYPIAVLSRLVRTSMLEVFRQDYVVAARAKGLHERRVILRHALKNALIPVITVAGMLFGFSLGGAVIIETVFARQGIGQLAVSAIQQRDMPLVQGTVIFVGIIIVLVNLIVDLAYGVVDPRIRYSS